MRDNILGIEIMPMGNENMGIFSTISTFRTLNLIQIVVFTIFHLTIFRKNGSLFIKILKRSTWKLNFGQKYISSNYWSWFRWHAECWLVSSQRLFRWFYSRINHTCWIFEIHNKFQLHQDVKLGKKGFGIRSFYLVWMFQRHADSMVVRLRVPMPTSFAIRSQWESRHRQTQTTSKLKVKIEWSEVIQIVFYFVNLTYVTCSNRSDRVRKINNLEHLSTQFG